MSRAAENEAPGGRTADRPAGRTPPRPAGGRAPLTAVRAAWERLSPGARSELLVAGALVVVYAAVLLTNLSVPQPTDHTEYMRAARTFPSRPGNPVLNHQYLRIGLIAPTALVMRIFGYSAVTYHAFPVAAGLLLMVSVHAIGRMLFGRLVGLLSACVLGFTGVVVIAGTELLPDLPATALFTAAIAVLVALRRRLLRRRRVWLVVAGALLGWSYLTREFIVFVWPLAAFLAWPRRGEWAGGDSPRWEWLWGVAPVALTGVGEMALNAALYGDPLKRLHASAGLGDLPSRPQIAATFRGLPLWVYLWRLPQQLGRQPEGPGLLLLLALTLIAGLVTAVAYLRRFFAREASPLPRSDEAGSAGGARWVGMFAVWVLLLWVALTLLGGVLDPARPRLRLQLLRYWYPVFPAFALGGVAALWLGSRVLRGRVVRGIVVSCVVLAIVGVAAAGRPGGSGWAGSARVTSDALPQFRSWLARSGARTVWADARLFRILPIYVVTPTGRRVWHGHLRPLLSAREPAPGDYVVVYSIGSNACPRCGQAAKAVLPHVPPTWRDVLTSRDRLLRVWQVA